MRSSPILRALFSAPAKPKTRLYYCHWKAKKAWPPDFTQLTPKHQFRLERRYRRRSALKWARPRWVKAVKIVQLSSILLVTVYGVLFVDWQQAGHQPFQNFRNWFFGTWNSTFGGDPERVRRRERSDDASPISKV